MDLSLARGHRPAVELREGQRFLDDERYDRAADFLVGDSARSHYLRLAVLQTPFAENLFSLSLNRDWLETEGLAITGVNPIYKARLTLVVGSNGGSDDPADHRPLYTVDPEMVVGNWEG